LRWVRGSGRKLRKWTVSEGDLRVRHPGPHGINYRIPKPQVRRLRELRCRPAGDIGGGYRDACALP